LKVILGGGTGDFFAVMAFGLATLFILLGLGRERLTVAATFFFIVLRPYGPALEQRAKHGCGNQQPSVGKIVC